ncbi:MAG: Tc toxin subunit A [Gammaproteobacteria bacterium]
MLAAGQTSAHSIYAGGRKRFVDTLTAAGATRSAARAIYARATQAHATTLALLANYNSAFTNVAPSAVAQPLAAATLQPMLASFPNLQSLFGANDYCSCEHCRSIHGPAAYLVDILQFLKQRTAASGTARDVLFARRPDLGAIELLCDNTNGVMPYIDLACEVLEDAVSAPSQDTVRARQTSGSPEELRANPRFVNEAAYTTLRGAVFPHTAPFDLWTAEVRAFLRQLGVPWHDLLAAFQVPAASPTDTQIAGERLGFNTSALTLVTTAAPAQPWTHWRLQETNNAVPDPRKPNDTTAVVTGTWLQVLAFVPILLHHADLRHRELVQLLATRFINPDGAIKIIETSADGFASCDTGKQTIATWTADALSRFNRFLRLWRQLGCTIWDLDKVLTTASVGNNAIDATAIAQLGRFEQIASRLGMPWDELLGLWSDVDRFSYLNVLDDSEVVMKSVYARRFRNATVTQSSSVFVEDPTTLQGPLGSAEAVAGISAALNLSGNDIQRIRAAAGLGAATTALNLTNLSVLFRYAILAGALHLSVAELVIAIAVTGVNPFSSPAKTLEFLAALDHARDSGFTLPELHYLLRHGFTLDSGIALADSTIAGWLEDLRKGVVRLGSGGDDFVLRRISDLLPLDRR